MTPNFTPPCHFDTFKRSSRPHKQFSLYHCNLDSRVELSNNSSSGRRADDSAVELGVPLLTPSHNANNEHLPNTNRPRRRRTVVPPIKTASRTLSLELFYRLASPVSPSGDPRRPRRKSMLYPGSWRYLATGLSGCGYYENKGPQSLDMIAAICDA